MTAKSNSPREGLKGDEGMTEITLAREHCFTTLMPRSGQEVSTGTVPAGTKVTVHGDLTATETELGIIWGARKIKVTDPDDPEFNVGTWLVRLEPSDWSSAGVCGGVEDEFGSYPPGHHERCHREFDKLAAEIGI